MELIENHIYSTKEMMEFFGVTKENWKKNKNKLLFHLSNFYEYEVTYDIHDLRKRNYKIVKKLFDYEPPQKKSVKRDKTYENKIIDIIEYDNLQTAKNVSRLIKDDTEIKAMNHKDGTIYEYTRVRMRIMFGTKVGEFGTKGCIEKKIWCKLDSTNNCYIQLSEELVNAFYDFFETEKNAATEEQLTLYSDYTNGLITIEELKEAIGQSGLTCFLNARSLFYAKYRFYPIKVPVYQLLAFGNNEDAEIVA